MSTITFDKKIQISNNTNRQNSAQKEMQAWKDKLYRLTNENRNLEGVVWKMLKLYEKKCLWKQYFMPRKLRYHAIKEQNSTFFLKMIKLDIKEY